MSKIDYEYVPIEKWPAEYTKLRRNAPFRSPYGKTLDLLESELLHLGATRVQLQVALERTDIRPDGRPRSGAKARHPGVIISFTTRKGDDLSFPCDTFTDFEDNMRAIALSLKSLRDIDRYGVTKRNEQYRGWVALPESTDSSKTAALKLAEYSGEDPDNIMRDDIVRESAYRKACKRTHPDTGDPPNQDEFIKVQDAIKLLRAGKAV